MRFEGLLTQVSCGRPNTSELKSAVIARAIRARHPTGTVISAVGIRREESPARARTPAAKRDERLTRARGTGLAWNPLIHWPRADVLDYVRARGDVLHAAYRIYGSSRVSCAFCVLASLGDLKASASCADNAAIYREIVDLEICSTFSFQSNRWLGDVAPDLLDGPARGALAEAKERAVLRQSAEAAIPRHLLYEAGWPTVLPTLDEARLLADVRRRVAEAVGLAVGYLDAESICERYAQLLSQRASREA